MNGTGCSWFSTDSVAQSRPFDLLRALVHSQGHKRSTFYILAVLWSSEPTGSPLATVGRPAAHRLERPRGPRE